ncbi:MAG TPA: hypothetical protein VN066_08900 [Rhodocyclaceae bacterium]|jgi:glucose/arabinose dehydrogenase|nr:hypothetical protein [Rhodocyclaceae bacterium]
MQTKLFSIFLMLTALVAGPAHARQSVPVINIENALITTSSGKTPTLAQVKQSIVAAGAAQGWQLSETADGKLLASLTVRGKHFMTIEIPYTTAQYSLLYKSSVNLNYEVLEGVPVIHPNYNKWVQTFGNNIRVELSKL